MADYPDLSKPLNQSQSQNNDMSYPDLSRPLTESFPISQNEPSLSDKIASYAKSFFPQPTLPLGMNVASGLMGSIMPQQQANIMRQLPQIASGTDYGMPQKVASGFGSTIPAVMSGGEGLLPQAISGAAQGFASAPQGQGLQSAAENALTTIGFHKALPYVANLFRSANPQKMANVIQQSHDSLSNEASQGFNNVADAVNQRGISQIPIDEDLLEKAGSYLPNTDAGYNLFSKATTGDYNALRDLQTELWHRATRRASSDLPSENDMAEQMFETRDKINQAMTNHMVNTGNEDLAQELNNARSNYANLKDIFYNKNLPRAIPKLVNPATREMPDNLMTVLQKDSVPMNNFRNNLLARQDANIPATINAMNARANLYNLTKKVGIGGSLLGGLGAAYHFLWPHNVMVPTPMQNP